MIRQIPTVCGALLAMMILSPAAAQETAPAPDTPTLSTPTLSTPTLDTPVRPRIAVDVEVGVWIPRLDGDVAFGANSSNPNLRLKQQFDLNDSELVVNAELTVRFDDFWYLRATAFDFSTDTTNTFVGNATFGSLALNNGDAFSASVDMTSISLAAGRDLFRPVPDRRRLEDSPTSIRLSGVAGARFLRVDHEVARTAGGAASATGNWLAIFAGVDLKLRWAADASRPSGRALTFDAGLGVGVDPAEGGLLVQVRAGLTLQFTDSIGVYFGYRLLEVDFEDAPYGFDAGLQGLFLGGSIGF